MTLMAVTTLTPNTEAWRHLTTNCVELSKGDEDTYRYLVTTEDAEALEVILMADDNVSWFTTLGDLMENGVDAEGLEGTEGRDRESYSDDQDRESYS